MLVAFLVFTVTLAAKAVAAADQHPEMEESVVSCVYIYMYTAVLVCFKAIGNKKSAKNSSGPVRGDLLAVQLYRGVLYIGTWGSPRDLKVMHLC